MESHASAAGRKPPATTTLFVPMLLLSLAIVSWLSLQAFQLLREREQLAQAQANLQPQQAAAAKLRASLDAVATATAKLASDGNAGAQTIVEELRKRGVTINPQGAAKAQ